MTFFPRMEFNTFSWVLQDISMLFIKICVISITLTTIWQIILFLTFFYTSIWHRICTLCPIFRYMILLNLDTCIPIIEISIYNIWYIFVQWGRLFYNEYIIVWWSWRRNWVEAKGYEGNILEENDDRLIWECFL